MAPNRALVKNGKTAKDVDPDVLVFNLNDLYVREIEEIEELTGEPFENAFGPDKPRGKMLRLVGYLVKKRENPDFTMEMAGDLRIVLEADAVDPQSPRKRG